MTTNFTREFIYEANQANEVVKIAVELHAKKFNLPIKYGFAGLQYEDKRGYGHIPYIMVKGNSIKVHGFGWHKDKKLAEILDAQPLLNKIACY